MTTPKPTPKPPRPRGKPRLASDGGLPPASEYDASKAYMREDLERSGLVPGDARFEPLPLSLYKAPAYRIHYPWGDAMPYRDKVLREPGSDAPKYLQPEGTPAMLYARSGEEYEAWAAARVKWIVEGEKKALAGMKRIGQHMIGVGGAQAPMAGGVLDSMIAAGIRAGDLIIVALDGDIASNPEIAKAAGSLGRAIMSLGATVEVLLLPEDAHGRRQGLDDWLLTVRKGQELNAVRALPRIDPRELPELNRVLIRKLRLHESASGAIEPTHYNASRLVQYYFGERLRRDKYLGPRFGDEALQDHHDGGILNWLQLHHCPRIGRQMLRDVRNDVLTRNPSNLLGDWLRGLKWDGRKRIDTFWQTYTGAKAQPAKYLEGVARSLFVGAVKRACEETTKNDFLITLHGPQAARKTTMWEVLGGELCGEPLTYLARMDKMEELVRISTRAWFLNFDELAGRSKIEQRLMKNWLSQTRDTWVPKYMEQARTVTRGFIAVATTNERETLVDISGNRRHLIVDTGPAIDIDSIKRDREQLFAEAMVMSSTLEKWWYVEGAHEQQEAHRERHPWELRIDEMLDEGLPKLKNGASFITTHAVLQSLGYRMGQDPTRDQGAATKVGTILSHMGFANRKVRTSTILYETVPRTARGDKPDLRTWLGRDGENVPETMWLHVRERDDQEQALHEERQKLNRKARADLRKPLPKKYAKGGTRGASNDAD